jgi:hypothetical protein
MTRAHRDATGTVDAPAPDRRILRGDRADFC